MAEIGSIVQSVITTSSGAYDAWLRYKVAQRHQRFEQVQAYLKNHVDDLEERLNALNETPAELDLFASVLNSLIEDDENQKVRFYAAILERVLAQDTPRDRIRMVAIAFKTLSCMELETLGKATRLGKFPRADEDWIQTTMRFRLESLGLYKASHGPVHGTRFTPLGALAWSIARTAENRD